MNIKGIETFFRSSSYTSVLDLLWVSPTAAPNTSSFRVAYDLHCGSDHYALTWNWSFPNPSSSTLSPSFNLHDDKSEEWMDRFSKLIKERWTFHDTLETQDVFLEATTVFTECMTQASLDTCACKPTSPKTARWFNQEVRESLHVMRTDRHRARYHATQHNLLRYRASNAQFRYKVKRAKRSYTLTFASRVTHKNLWQLNSWYWGVRRTYSPLLIRPDGTPASDTSEKCQLLLDAWFPPPVPIPGSFHCVFSSPLPSTRPFPSVTHLEISDALCGTSSTSAPGYSGLNYKVLKWAFVIAPDKLASIVRASIHLGVHHPLWKKAVIVSIPKANKRSYVLPCSHRPIQLLECLGKLVEKVVAKRLLFDTGKHHLMPFTQFGGHSHTSCLDAGLALTHDIESARSARLVSSFLALDIKGFFDHVNHDRLVHTLWEMGFPCQICSWVLSFLSGCSASVHLDDFSSPFAPINVGVPQGSPISPVLTCLYAAPVIRQLTNNTITSSIGLPTTPRSYVDDLAFLAISNSLAENCIILDATLQQAETLFAEIGMTFDPDKCDLMHFSWRRERTLPSSSPSFSPSLHSTLNGLPITITPPKFIQWLSFHLDRRLTFFNHIRILAVKGKAITTGLQCLGNTVRGLSPHHMRLLYRTCVIPIITYSCQLWYQPDAPKHTLIKRLQIIQNEALH